MAQKPKTAKTDARKLQKLLERHACPVPYHEVRTRLLGNIATPDLKASPLRVVEGLWGGELPVFDSTEDLNTLIGALVGGLWNELTRHQKRTEPFRLTRPTIEPTAADLARLALIRRQEIDGFVEGLFNGKEEIDLPGKAHAAVQILADIRAMVAGVHDLVQESQEPVPGTQIEGLISQLAELTRIIEKEIHAVLLDCTRARRQLLETMTAAKPTKH